jgi:hypothetical protein
MNRPRGDSQCTVKKFTIYDFVWPLAEIADASDVTVVPATFNALSIKSILPVKR